MSESFVLKQGADRRIVVDYVMNIPLDRPILVTFEEKVPNRSLAQNRLYWMWLRDIQQHIFETTGKWFSVDPELHDWFRQEFLPRYVVELAGTVHEARRSTKKLTVKEFGDYLELIEWYASEHLGLILPRPDELYMEAILGTEKVPA